VRQTPELVDEELVHATRQVVKAIAQTLDNRAYRRPAISGSEPRQSALAQREYDEETVRKYEENIQPEVVTLREEYLARGEWRMGLEDRYSEPASVATLQDLVIELDALTDAVAEDARDDSES
jgi:hypothetical protein